MSNAHRVVVIGGGVAGLTAALSIIADSPTPVQVTVLEAKDSVGGIIRTSPFAGLPAVDEAADAFLVRVPHAQQLATELGLGAALTAPTGAHASVWHNGLHNIPGTFFLVFPQRHVLLRSLHCSRPTEKFVPVSNHCSRAQQITIPLVTMCAAVLVAKYMSVSSTPSSEASTQQIPIRSQWQPFLN